MGVKNGRSLASSEHRRHDRLLVTRFAMDDAYPGELAEARSLIESCAECAALAADIRLISASVSRLPTPKRPRDFTINAEQAESLRGSRLTRWLRSLSGPGWAALRPVSAAALSIGLVMAVVGTSLPQTAPAAVTHSGGAPLQANELEPGTPSRAPADVPVVGAPLPPEDAAPEGQVDTSGAQTRDVRATQDPVTERLDMAYATSAPGESADDGGEIMNASDAPAADPARNLLVYAGLVIAILSFGLLALAWFARRYVADPLLR